MRPKIEELINNLDKFSFKLDTDYEWIIKYSNIIIRFKGGHSDIERFFLNINSLRIGLSREEESCLIMKIQNRIKKIEEEEKREKVEKERLEEEKKEEAIASISFPEGERVED